MNYLSDLKYHFKTRKGWVNDPNGLVYYNGYYHVFYQHSPNFERPWLEPMHWGHARTRDFLEWEELPVALAPDMPYDDCGCWSGTAIVKEGLLYLLYASIYKPEGSEESLQTVSVAYSEDGINFKKYDKNPVIDHYPPDGSRDFRDPAVCFCDGKYHCVMASGNREKGTANLLLYESEDLFDWKYCGVLCEWENGIYAECPSFMPAEDGRYLLSASVCLHSHHYFSAMYGRFQDGKFTVEYSVEIDKGPDQYAGQAFRDDLGRNILISWFPGWKYAGYAERDVGCMSLPRELTLKNGIIRGYPIEEVRHLLKDSDPALRRTANGFEIERKGREPVVYEGEINELKLLRDEYVLEVFINGGEEIYTVLL